MKVIVNKEGKYLISGAEPFPSFTNDGNDPKIYFSDSIATIVAAQLGLKTLTKNLNDTKKECLRCGHKWRPRKKDVIRICPACKSPYWDKIRINIKHQK